MLQLFSTLNTTECKNVLVLFDHITKIFGKVEPNGPIMLGQNRAIEYELIAIKKHCIDNNKKIHFMVFTSEDFDCVNNIVLHISELYCKNDDTKYNRLRKNIQVYKYTHDYDAEHIFDCLKNTCAKKKMKFDYIIQNPPYSGTLHLEFLKKGLDMLDNNGKMTIIEPAMLYLNMRDTDYRTKKYIPTIAEFKGHIKRVEIDLMSFDFGISSEVPLAITYIDKSKTFDTIDTVICGDEKQITDIDDCNFVGDRNTVESILKKCKKLNDMFISHVDKKSSKNSAAYVKYQGRVVFSVSKHFYTGNRYGDYNNLGNFIHDDVHGLTICRNYVDPAFFKTGSIYNEIKENMQNFVMCDKFDTYEENKNALENWKHFIYNTYLGHFIMMVCTIDKSNTVRDYLPWITEYYNDEQLYTLFEISAEEQQLIEKTVKKYDRESPWFKRYMTGDTTIKCEEVKKFIDTL